MWQRLSTNELQWPCKKPRQSTICWKKGVKFSVVFLMFEKPLTLFGLTVCYTNCIQNLESEVECGWLSKIYTDVKAQVLFSGSLSRQLDISDGNCSSGKNTCPLHVKVYINALLKEFSSHACRVSINTLSLTSPSLPTRYIFTCYSTILPNSRHAHVLLLRLEVEI